MKHILSTIIFILALVYISRAQTFDTLEYATGNQSAQQQLLTYQLPRFKPNHTLNRNFIWFSLDYYSGFQQGITTPQMISVAKVNNVEFYKNWNYYFMVQPNIRTNNTVANYADTINNFNGAMIAIAKRNPTWKTSAIAFWNQLGGNVTNKTLSNNHYIRNASGQFLNLSGTVITNTKFWSPTAPLSSAAADGTRQRSFVQGLNTALGRPVTILNDNGEAIQLISRNGVVVNNDPTIRADYVSLGYAIPTTSTAVNDYRGRRFTDQTISYRTQMLSTSPSTIFTHYGLDGQTDYRPIWTRSKFINTPIGGKYYSTGDFYVRYPFNWKAWTGAWHGLGWFADTKFWEMKAGDSLMSPFVSAGWNIDETKNMRPAQYLASLKILTSWGAEMFYPAYFNLAAPFPDSKNWGWQTVMPVYAQAITSRYESLFRSSYSLNGDVPMYFLSSTTLWPKNPKYLFYTGESRKLVAVRKAYSSEKYIITTAQMVDSNTVNNAPDISYAKFKLGTDSLRVEFRRQGSVYYYDATSSVFFQYDKWHQREHPERWSKDIVLEAELADSLLNSPFKSYNIIRNGINVDLTNVTTSIQIGTTSLAIYSFNSRPTQLPNTSVRHNVWVRIKNKSINTATVTININDSNNIVIPCVTDTNWVWYKATRHFNNMNNVLKVTTNNNVEIDQIIVTTSDVDITTDPYQTCYSLSRYGLNQDIAVTLKVIPTETTSFVNIEIDTLEDVEGPLSIYDISGKLYKQISIQALSNSENRYTINVYDLTSGMYIAMFEYNTGKSFDRFIKR